MYSMLKLWGREDNQTKEKNVKPMLTNQYE